MTNQFFAHQLAEIDEGAKIGEGTKVWRWSHIRESVRIGEGVVVGQGVYVDAGVSIGHQTKIQNKAQIFGPSWIGEGVFIGPGVVITNDRVPRAVNPDFSPRLRGEWRPLPTEILDGCSIGAGAVIVAPCRLGRWSMVAAGAVVAENVLNYSLVAGVPARHVTWVDACGARLEEKNGEWVCTACSSHFFESSAGLEPSK